MTAKPKDNEIAFFIYRNRLLPGVFISGEGGKVRFSTGARESLNVPTENVVLCTGEVVQSQGEAAAWLEKVEQASQAIDLEEVWELVKEEKETWTFEGLADLCLSEGATSRELSGLLVGLESSRFFDRLESGYFPLGEEAVAEKQAAEAKESSRAEEKRLFQCWLSDGEAPGGIEKQVELWVTRLMDCVLYGASSTHARWLTRMTEERVDERRLFERLVRAGVWRPDEHLDLIREEIPISFSDEALALSKELAIDLEDGSRKDLRSLPVYTIDDTRTTDMDDGVSLLFREDGTRQLGIHITDVTSLVPCGSVLDQEAYERGSSLYFPDLKVPMLPHLLSSDLGSLSPDTPRLALSMLFEVDRDDLVGQVELVPSIVQSKGKLSYERVDEILENPRDPLHSEMKSMHCIAEAHWMERLQAGAIDVEHPERRILVNDEGDVSVELLSNNSASNLLVSEMMVLANVAIARFCDEHQIPVVYRVQKAPDLSKVAEEENEILRRYRVLRQMSRANLSEEPGLHGGLGVSQYCQATSPLRRFADLAVQRQLMAFLKDESLPYSAEEIRSKLLQSGEQFRTLVRMERKRERYWLFKYLQDHSGQSFEAMVLDVLDREIHVEVVDFAFQTRIKPARPVEPGDRIDIKLVRSDPWEDSISFTQIN